MNKRTPKREKTINMTESPGSGSPQKNLTGPARIIKDIIADLYNNIQRWNSHHINGCSIVKQIASIKSDTPKNSSIQLEESVNELYNVVQQLEINRNVFITLINQCEAFAKLPNVENPVFFSLEASNIAHYVNFICLAYINEFKTKKLILENIAFSKNTNDVMFLATYWTHQLNITGLSNFYLECLLVETGHRVIK